jgi:hypothetical protein
VKKKSKSLRALRPCGLKKNLQQGVLGANFKNYSLTARLQKIEGNRCLYSSASISTMG